MYDNLEEFKERLYTDSEFKNLFVDVTNLDEAVAVARENGYNLDMDRVIEDRELSDDMLEAVAGGSSKYDELNQRNFTGDGTINFKGTLEDGQKIVDELHRRGIYGKH